MIALSFRKLSILGVLVLVSCFNLGSSPAFGAINVELTVQEESGINRVLEPVTFGFPIAEDSNIVDVTSLCVKDSSGQVVPAQFRVLERWDSAASNASGTIKWVLVDFQASVSANLSTIYYVQDSGGNVSPPALSVSQDNDILSIDTGNAVFVVDKNN